MNNAAQGLVFIDSILEFLCDSFNKTHMLES